MGTGTKPQGRVLSADLQKAGFVSTLPKTKHRVIMATDGREKSGKTRFALTAPPPIIFLNFDHGLEGPLEEEFGNKVMAFKSFDSQLDYGKLPTVKQAEGVWMDFANAYMAALNTPGVRSIIVDTFSDAWDWARLMHFGKFSPVLPNHYTEVNDITKRLVMQAHNYNVNVIFIHKQKEDWKDNKPTGNYKREGIKHMGYAVHVNATHTRTLVNGVNKWGLSIADARQNIDLAGMTLEDGQVTFPYLAEMLFPKTTEKDWV